MCPRVPVLYDWMTVAEIGWFAAGFHLDSGATSGYQSRYRELIRGFELPRGAEDQDALEGDAGQGVAGAGPGVGPELLILDEPTSGLDVLVRREFLESMVDLAGEGRTVLLSSHQISEVERVASHVALMHRGKLILAEPLDDLKARTFLLSVTFTSRDHPVGAARREAARADRRRRTPRARRAGWCAPPTAPRARPSARCRASSALEIETPSLEEIYIGYMRAAGPRRAAALAVHVA